MNNVNFDDLFTDNLPQQAIELQQYVADLTKRENNGEERAERALKKAAVSLEKVRNISKETLSFYLMVSDILDPPKGVQLRRP